MVPLRAVQRTVALGFFALLLAGCPGSREDLATTDSSAPVATTTPVALVQSGSNHTFAVGSLIIPMDTTYQDNGIFLAYGLVYQLLLNKVPVSWVIKSGKRLSTITTTGATDAAGTATFTTTQPHDLAAGDIVVIAGVGQAGYNGSRTVIAVPSATTFTATVAAGLAASGNGTVTPSDFTASATDKQGGPAITNYAYRGGPFVIDQADAATATPIITTWQTANPTTKVHVATTAFSGYVKRELIAAPTIAMFADGNQMIAQAYLQAAKIPDSQGNAWLDTSPDLLTPDEVAGPSCSAAATTSLNLANSPTGATEVGTTATFTTTAAHGFGVGYVVTVAGVTVTGYNGNWTVASVPSPTTFTATLNAAGLAASGKGTATNICLGTPHDDGALFDQTSHLPAYCQMMSMHWDVTNAATTVGREVVREYRRFLTFPTHLMTECQAANAVENNANVALAIATATEAGTTATFTTTVNHNFSVGDMTFVTGNGVAGYTGNWVVASILSPTSFTATWGLTTAAPSGLAASGGGAVNNFNGLFLTTTGYLIGPQPAGVDSFSFDQPFTQFDGVFDTTGGSEPSYSIPPGGSYKAQDTVMLTEHGTPPGTDDVWMTGFLDGKCDLSAEFCDPSFAQGKVSVLGGHNYGTNLPESGGQSQGTRLFLNALFEAPCATDLGAASIDIVKTGPNTTNGGTVTYTLTVLNPGSSVAGATTLTDVLAPGVSFVSATNGGTAAGNTVTWHLGSVGPGQNLNVSVTVQFATTGIYDNTATATFKAGATTLTASSNTTQTCYYAGNPAICGGGCDPNAPKCANGCDDDGDGLIDFPDDPGCDSLTDNNETDPPPQTAIKGRVLIVQDTSGSMMWNTCGDVFTGGDGSLSCPGADVACGTCGTSGCGNGIPDDSRIRKVKTGITNAVSGFGEVEWGLMRFKQLPTQFSCGTTNVNRNDGGWQGAGPSSGCGALAAGELLTKFDPENENDLLAWMDEQTNYATFPPPPGKDFELRPSGNTPLAGSLTTARSYIAATRSADSPTVAACRPYKVILVTDGAETCGGDPAAQASLLYGGGDPDGQVQVYVIGFSTPDPVVQSQLNAIAAAGGTSTYVSADDDAQLSAAIEEIVKGTILVELCNGLDDDCDGKIDEDFPDKGAACDNGALGVCKRPGTRVCAANGDGTVCSVATRDCSVAGSCADLGQTTEICNGLDDDCDGKIDEGLTCTTCVPTAEICDGIDNDCDGKIDEGLTRACGTGACTGVETCDWSNNPHGPPDNGYGGCTAQVPTAETCDGLDNDCDGIADGFTLACSNIVTPGGPASDNPGDPSHNPIPQNLCHPGSESCPVSPPGNGTFTACTGEQVPQPEICNGLDDDCDNNIDEDFVPQPCSTSCGLGQTKCVNGQITCDAQAATGDATCNNIDDDCDGKIDEDWKCDDPNSNPNAACACGSGVVCNGVAKCIDGAVQCVGGPINQEECNCLDDDCDGKIDEGVTCPGGATCTNCQCAFPCSGGEFPCPQAKKCVANFCVVDPCFGVSCPAVNGNAQTCIDNGNTTSSCVDACTQTTCPAPLVCFGPTGQCAPNDCTTFPAMCTTGQHCVVGADGSGACESDPCAGVTCPANEYCETGQCFASCDGVTCPTGQRCRLGTCQADPCGAPCPAGQVCHDATGTCGDDLCVGHSCQPGQACDPSTGMCETDPCAGVTCPGADQTCQGGTCFGPPTPTGGQYVTTGGGGGCDAGGGGAGLLVLGLLLAPRRRREVRS